MIQLFYASSAINRHGEFRNNEKFLNTIITEKDTKFIPFYNGKNLFIEINENINSVILNKFQLHDFFPNGIGGTIFLGVANDLNYVGIDLSSPNKKFDYWLKENNIIVDDLRVPSNTPFSSTIIWSAESSPINLFLIKIEPDVLYLPSKTPSPSSWEQVSKFFTLSFNGEEILLILIIIYPLYTLWSPLLKGSSIEKYNQLKNINF